ncbi:AraC family transcriptional regulator [Inquilinus sp. NPDC058860]|uniref:AraC family transcriptional regulator n=1 Tax=Inquilinus sp. NPDC058860 TaxID=3346652 RepID=UPI003695921D
MDPLSDVLSLLKPRSYVSAGFDAGGDWSIRFSRQHDRIKCYAVVSGACWLSVEGVPDPVRLKAGDCFVLPSGRPFRLASDMALTPVDAGTVFPPARDGGVVTVNGGGGFFLVGSRFAVSGDHAGILLGMLPPIVHIRKEAEQAALRWSVERMMQELHERQPGGFLVAQHLAHMMLVQALRLHLEGAGGGVGWFFALADRQIGAAINAMHADPAHRWTLQELAQRAGMSRSSFALRFKEKVGEAPMEYLTRWRMLLAGDRLATSGDPVSAIAPSLGYESESAFSTAFKRVMGCSPRQYGRGRAGTPPSRDEGEAARADSADRNILSLDA